MSAHELNEYLTNRADQEFELVKVNELNDHELNDHELNDRELNDHELNESSSSFVQPYMSTQNKFGEGRQTSY